jgi:hypothetical protein
MGDGVGGWEQLHSGPWSEVGGAWRDTYALACLHVAWRASTRSRLARRPAQGVKHRMTARLLWGRLVEFFPGDPCTWSSFQLPSSVTLISRSFFKVRHCFSPLFL